MKTLLRDGRHGGVTRFDVSTEVSAEHDNRSLSHIIPIRNGTVSYLFGHRHQRRRSMMIDTTIVASSPAAMNSWPSGLDIWVGSMGDTVPAPRTVGGDGTDR